jgi:hypothetical protein
MHLLHYPRLYRAAVGVFGALLEVRLQLGGNAQLGEVCVRRKKKRSVKILGV